jgi:hypothetical protein
LNPVRTVSWVVLPILLVACSALASPLKPGTVLFQDDFTSTATGWDRLQDPRYDADYVEGSYRIVIHESNLNVWSTPGLELRDVIIRASAVKTAGPDDNSFGLLCRYRNPNNFYFLLVSSDGYAGIGQVLDGKREMLTGDAMLPSPAGPLSGDVLVEASCVADSLALKVDEILIVQASSQALAEGDVGVIAATYGQGGLEVRFDDFAVVQPGG